VGESLTSVEIEDRRVLFRKRETLKGEGRQRRFVTTRSKKIKRKLRGRGGKNTEKG